MVSCKFCLTAAFVLSALCAGAQGKVLGYPTAYMIPIDPYEHNLYEDFIGSETVRYREDKRAWWVLVDRENVKAYDGPGGVLIAKLKFGSAFYVTDEQGEWLELADAVVDKLEIKKIRQRIGWVNKKDLLLWNEGLRSPRGKVELRVLVGLSVAALQNFNCETPTTAPVYSNPKFTTIAAAHSLRGLFAVYKKEGDRLLIGNTAGLSYFDPDLLIGWVDKKNCLTWNSRVALEPNFTIEAYNERKNNASFQISGFPDPILAEAYGQGKPVQGNVIWNSDPAWSKQDVSALDAKRFRGDIMRFPVLPVGVSSKNTLNYFKSAVFSKITRTVTCKDGATKDLQVEVMTPVYFCRKPIGAKHPSFSYVACWSEKELLRLHEKLGQLLLKHSASSFEEKRSGLFEFYSDLVKEFGSIPDEKPVELFSIKEVFECILGISDENIDIQPECIRNVTLECLLDRQCIPDEAIDRQFLCWAESQKKIDRILRDSELEEFKFQAEGEQYYWVKLSDMF